MFPQLFLTAFLSLMSLNCAGFLMCDSDKDCQDGSSCIENICKICVKCSLIFRKGNNCESDFNDCGDCLDGYKEISVTDNSAVKKPCTPIRKKGYLKECATDNHCPPNNYCSEKSCVNCFDCSLINRVTPEKCARDLNDCGPCVVGYLSIHGKSRTNYNKCEKVLPDRVPYDIASGSVLIAFIMAIAVGIAVLFLIKKNYTGFASFKSISQQSDPSAPPFDLINTQFVKHYNENECSMSVECESQEMQQAKVFRWPSASYYPKEGVTNEETSEPDSGQNETSNVPDQPASAQREGTISSPGTVICGECARRMSLSEVHSINSDSGSQDEQPVGVNVLNNDSAENNSHLMTDDPVQVPEDQDKEATEDLSLGEG